LKITKFAGISVASGTITTGVTAVTLSTLGFSGAGIAAGSAAASIQSGLLGGAIVKGSLMAIAQSTGALGLGTILSTVFIPASLVGGSTYIGYNLFCKYKVKPKL
jgi:hypothetical protein